MCLSDDLKDAAQIMGTAAVHRLPVVDQDRIVGVLSVKDIALAAHRGWSSTGSNVAERQMAEIMEAIAAAWLSAAHTRQRHI